ncbi:prepilin peptidase [Nocardioides zeae]
MLVPVGVLLSYVDWRTLLLPTRVIYPAYAAVAALMVLATLATGATDDLQRAGIAALVGLVCYWLPWRISASWMGFGDVRLSGLLAGVLGWAGWAEVALGLYLPFLLGGVVAGLLMLLRLVARGAYPLGPFMFVGTLVGLWCGPLVLPGLSG